MCNVKSVMENKYTNYIFDFEKLDVYRLGIDFVNKVINIVKKLPSELRFTLGTNFIRAALSISSNIAEGSGKKFKKEKALFYGYALTSARECVPTITVLHHQKQIDNQIKYSLRADCIKVCNMLAKLIVSVH